MKRAMRWSEPEDESSSSDDDSSSETESVDRPGKLNASGSIKSSKVKSAKRKTGGGIDFDALSRHGYKGGLSVLKVPPPKEEDEPRDWSWSTGRDDKAKLQNKDEEESYEERQKTRAVVASAEQRAAEAVAMKEKKNAAAAAASFAQKEKRKRDLGQASRGKSYVEEEKRLLRDSGIYSGFDS